MTNRHESSCAKKHDQWSSKTKKGTRHVIKLAIPCNTTESVVVVMTLPYIVQPRSESFVVYAHYYTEK